MNLTKQELMEKIGVTSPSTIYTYLARSEFAHINRVKYENETILTNIKIADIVKLKLLTHRRNLTNKQKDELHRQLEAVSKKN